MAEEKSPRRSSKFFGLGMTAWVGLAVILLFVYFTGVFSYIQKAIGLAVTTPPGQGNTPPVVVVSPGGCPTSGLTTVNVKAQFTNYSAKNAIQGRATTVQAFRKDTATSIISTTSNATGEISPATVGCGNAVDVFVGDNGASTAYNVLKSLSQAEMTTAQASVYADVLIPQTLSLMEFTNGSNGVYASTVVVNNAGSSSNNRAQMRLTAGTFSYGDGAYEICAQYPQANISDVDIQVITAGFSIKTIFPDPSVSVVAGNRMSCYEVSGVAMQNNQQAEFRLVPQFNGPVTAANVTISTNDRSSYIKNGKFLPGQDGTMGRYVDDKNNDLGLPVVTQISAVSYNT